MDSRAVRGGAVVKPYFWGAGRSGGNMISMAMLLALRSIEDAGWGHFGSGTAAITFRGGMAQSTNFQSVKYIGSVPPQVVKICTKLARQECIVE